MLHYEVDERWCKATMQPSPKQTAVVHDPGAAAGELTPDSTFTLNATAFRSDRVQLCTELSSDFAQQKSFCHDLHACELECSPTSPTGTPWKWNDGNCAELYKSSHGNDASGF